MSGEWFDIDPWHVFDSVHNRAEVDRRLIFTLNEHIKKLEWKINECEIMLSEQEEIVEDIFRSKFLDKSGKLFDEYSQKMCQKYKNILSFLEKMKSGKEEDGKLFRIPRWKYLAEK